MTMFIHLNSDGTIAKVLHDRVIRRSNVNKIYVFAPFAPGSTVLIHFQKPNGELITGPMIFKEFNLANQINTWEYSLMNRTITDIAGKVLISLEIRAITEGGVEITATPNTHMWVEESIGELPEIEEVDEFLMLANQAHEKATQALEIALELEDTDYTPEDKAKVQNLPADTNEELGKKLDKTALATQQEAEEGQNVQKWMNPFRVKQAIEAQVGEALDLFDLNGKIKVSLLPDSIVHSLEFRGTIGSLEEIAINGNYFPTQLEKGWFYITSNSFSIANRLTTLDIPIEEEYNQLRSVWNGWTFTRYDADYPMTTNFLSGDMFIICDIDPTEKVIYFGYIDNNASDLKHDIADLTQRLENLELAVDSLGEIVDITLDDAIAELDGRTLREFFEVDNPTILDQWEITLPNGVRDEVISQNYVRNIGKYVLQESDITLQYLTNTRRIRIEPIPPGSVPQSTTAIYIEGFEPADLIGGSAEFDNEIYADKYVWDLAVSSRINITVKKDKYIDADDAKAKLAGTAIYYQLATPVSTPMPSGIIDDSSLEYYYQAYKAGGIARKNKVLERLIALEEKVDNLEKRVDNLALSGDDINVENYVIPELEAARIKNIDFANRNNFTFAVLTDTHDQLVVPHLFNAINAYERKYGNLDCVMHHGDLTNGYEDLITHKLKLLKNIKQLQKIDVPFLIAIGNHDYNNNGGSVYEKLTDKEWHAIALNPFTRRLNMVFDSQNPNSKYYYTDFESKKIRVITLESGNAYGGFPEHQLNWLGNEALDFSEKIDRSEWAVIIQSHMPTRPEVNYYSEPVANGDKVENLLKAFVNGTSYTDGGSVNVDFTSQGGMEVIAWLCGHGHCDIIHKPADLYWYYVMTTNGHQIERTGIPASPYATIPEKEIGTVNEFAFDIFNVDRENRKVTITRIGAGSDREFTY